ncbi:FadR/GntR family transcriptional regulator [Amnibacterium kyonggiense]|nr:GntR family transcriptional regulator [Amnibacterium kyonggiense]
MTGSLAAAAVGPATGRSRVDDVTDRLITAVAVGEYLPGSRLPPERDLAASLGAGRMTVRAAIARLVERGLLETQRGRAGGSFVVEQWTPASAEAVRRTLDERWEDLRDRCEAIARLHGALCRAAAERRSEHDAGVMAARLEAYRAAASGLAKQQADSRLHLAIIDAAHNRTLARVLRDEEAALSIGAPAHLWGPPEGMPAMEARALREHEALVAAIVGRSADDAEAIARAHVGIDLELLEAARLRADGLGAGA